MLLDVMDREEKDTYYLSVTAMLSTASRDTVNVTIHVLDVNDNAPTFIFPTVEDSMVTADVSTGYVITTLQAQDVDADENAQLTYGILDVIPSDVFAIDPSSGEVMLISDMHSEQYILTVAVRDGGEPLRGHL